MDQTTNCGNCRRCLKGKMVKFGPIEIEERATRMLVCPTCGNKRCPKASDHELNCTGSNDIGQSGSVYGGLQNNGEENQT